MATLKEAVDSGRRWRHPLWSKGWWAIGDRFQNGDPHTQPILTTVDIALSSEYVIEPEKPREIILCEHENEFAISRHIPSMALQNFCTCGEHPSGKHVRFHDADECDRLRGDSWGHTCRAQTKDFRYSCSLPLRHPYAHIALGTINNIVKVWTEDESA